MKNRIKKTLREFITEQKDSLVEEIKEYLISEDEYVGGDEWRYDGIYN
jgi:hypothetical protein